MVNGYLPTSFWLNWVFRIPLGKNIIFKISNWVIHVFVLGILIEEQKSCVSLIPDLPLALRISQPICQNIGSDT